MTKNDKKIHEDILENDQTIVAEDDAAQDDEGKVIEEEIEEVTKDEEQEEINWEEKYKRALADYQNLEKRSQDFRSEWIRSSNRELLLRILPVLDTLMLATEHSDDKSLKVSVQQFLDILKSEGVTKIDAIGKDFDPHLMEAVSTEEGEEGKVMSEVQVGYTIHDKLLRPALVKVGKSK